VLSFPLAAGERAALNLFADEAGAFDDEDIELGGVLASHASTLLALAEAEETATNLRAALQHSRDIGAAVGILMALRRTTREEAFGLLRVASQHTHRKLHELALEVVETGALPATPDLA
jgi:AmiR/NasT family two-component response regulator